MARSFSGFGNLPGFLLRLGISGVAFRFGDFLGDYLGVVRFGDFLCDYSGIVDYLIKFLESSKVDFFCWTRVRGFSSP